MPAVKRSNSATPSPSPSPSSEEQHSSSAAATPTKEPKKSPAKPKKTPTKASQAGSDGEKKTGSWSGDDIMALYQFMCPKRQGVNWTEFAAQIGRDSKSCQNKWARVQNRIDQAIRELGE